MGAQLLCTQRIVLWLSLHNALHLHATGAQSSGLEGDLYSAPANCTLADLRRLINERLDEADFARFHRATGTGIGELLDRSQQWVTRARRGDKSAADTDEISFVRAFMSNCALYAHELNAYGLHPLRALLAERMFDAQRAQHGSASHPTWESFQRDGIIVLPNFNIASNLQGVGVDRPTWYSDASGEGFGLSPRPAQMETLHKDGACCWRPAVLHARRHIPSDLEGICLRCWHAAGERPISLCQRLARSAHHRQAPLALRPGAKREAARLDGRGGGCSGCIPRKNVYACIGSGIDTVSESTFDPKG